MTAGSLRLRLQDRDGLYAFDCRGDIAPQWTSEGGGWKVTGFSSAKIEIETSASQDVRVSLGLSFNRMLH